MLGTLREHDDYQLVKNDSGLKSSSVGCKVVCVLNYLIKHYTMKAYGGVEA
jgi:hypothetical protein